MCRSKFLSQSIWTKTLWCNTSQRNKRRKISNMKLVVINLVPLRNFRRMNKRLKTQQLFQIKKSKTTHLQKLKYIITRER
uniref:Uncharacterized protein n=1 Tax=Salix viminalis TaxID=40686 RepID=A0A6N2K6S1_SALVM